MLTNLALKSTPEYERLLSPESQLPLTKSVVIKGEVFDITSDLHLPMDQAVVDRVIEDIVSNQQAETLFCVGDIFDAQNGEDTSAFVSDYLTKLARAYPQIVYPPGNHCLRSKDEPWGNFTLPSNVYMPIADQPIVLETENNRCLIGNCLFDFKLVDPALVSMNIEEIEQFFKGEKDGKFLRGIDRALMESMAHNLAEQLSSDISVLVTHTLPHPAAATFRVAEITPEHLELAEKLGLPFISDPEDDLHQASRWNTTPEGFRKWWNNKSFIMGSNIINRPNANPANGLSCVFGHNHRNSDTTITAANGASVLLLAHQPYGGRDPQAWQAILNQ
jgi:hypothetical protein